MNADIEEFTAAQIEEMADMPPLDLWWDERVQEFKLSPLGEDWIEEAEGFAVWIGLRGNEYRAIRSPRGYTVWTASVPIGEHNELLELYAHPATKAEHDAVCATVADLIDAARAKRGPKTEIAGLDNI